TLDWFSSDSRFHLLYPEPVRELAMRHWTPLEVAKKSAGFLSMEKGSKILDIGSGSGKFCLIAARFQPECYFTGVEQRKELIDVSNETKAKLGLTNVNFIHDNFTNLDFSNYNHFYFYNSFYENLDGMPSIDKSVPLSEDLYHMYNRKLYRKLSSVPSGTRLVTYHSAEKEIPSGFLEVNADENNMLKFWIKL
ncbi:MAG TPA: methyltransferase domain-containing protein, partial [Parasegetibacter sp.]